MGSTLNKIHNYFRSNWSWYHKWHNFKYSNVAHFLFLVGFIFILLFLFNFLTQKQNTNLHTDASSSQNNLTSQADWNVGTLVSADVATYPGNIAIDGSASSLIPQSTYNMTASISSEQTGNAKDGDLGTAWSVTVGDLTPQWIKIDLGADKIISKIRTNVWPSNYTPPEFEVSKFYINYSIDDISYTPYKMCTVSDGINGFSDVWEECNETTSNNGRYIKFDFNCVYNNCFETLRTYDVSVKELEIYAKDTTTHTSAPTQIGDVSSDPGRYVVEYNSFDTTETEPANTTIDYRFQLVNASGVSTDGWTAWASGDVADLATAYPSQLTLSQTKINAGETYLQVQSRLTTTDGVSTPTLSDYTASYHTNKAPNAPVAQ